MTFSRREGTAPVIPSKEVGGWLTPNFSILKKWSNLQNIQKKTLKTIGLSLLQLEKQRVHEHKIRIEIYLGSPYHGIL